MLGHTQKSFKPNVLLEDFDFAVSELQLRHQGFYQYVEKETVDQQIADLRSTIERPMTRLEFYQLMRRLVALMNEGHGSVDLPKGARTKIGLSRSFLPLTVRFLDDKLIVTQNFGAEVEGLTKGAQLLSINGIPISTILKKLLPLIASDGFNETSKYEWIGSINLSLLYRLVYGKQKDFQLEIIDFETRKQKKITTPAIRFTAFKSKNAKLGSKSFNYTKFTFEQINDSIAYLSIPSFGEDTMDYEAFYRKQFRKIDSLNIKHLILDIQDNGGGTEGNENLLFSYLSSETIQKYKKVTMLPTPYEKNKNSKDYKLDKWERKGAIAERGKFTLYSDYYSDLGYTKPEQAYIYEDKLYILISGWTFSGGAEFASLIKMSDRGIFIGEEVGGAYEGNVSGYSQTIQLPRTKIKIDIPTVHFQINVNPEVKGRGVMPDYRVPQTWEDYMNSTNTKFEFAKRLILEN